MTEQLTLHDYIDILRRRWHLILAVFTVLVLAAVIFAVTRTPLYQAGASVLVNQENSSDIFDLSQGDRSSFGKDRLVENELRFAHSTRVTDEVVRRFVEELPAQYPELMSRTTNQFVPALITSKSNDSDVFDLVVEHSDPSFAAVMADVYAQAYIKVRNETTLEDSASALAEIAVSLDDIEAEIETERKGIEAEQEDNEGERDSDLLDALKEDRRTLRFQQGQLRLQIETTAGVGLILDEATVPTVPVSPNRRLIVGSAGILGLLLGVGLALLLELLDTSVSNKQEMEKAANGLANLAVVPTVDSWRSRDEARIVSLSEPNSPTAEAYRALRAAVEFAAIDRELQFIQVTSAMPGEGKSTTSSNLAVAMARAGRNVLLIDGDLRKPRSHQFFGVAQAPGLTSIIARTANLSESAIEVFDETGKVTILTAGELPPGPSELLGSQRAGEVFKALRRRFDIVIIDSAPILPVSDSLVLSQHVDATILVASASRSKVPEIRAAIELLEGADAPLIGTVLNQAAKGKGGYGYGYGYGVEHEAAQAQKSGKRNGNQAARQKPQPKSKTPA